MNDNHILFLYHIPKTGGTSLREALSAILGFNTGFVHLGPYGDRARQEKNLPALDQFRPDDLAKIRVISGHYLSYRHERYFPDRTILRAILLREPATRILSQYNHAMRNRAKLGEKPVGFREWYEQLAVPAFDWPRLSGRKLTLTDKKFAIASVGHNYMSKFILDAMGDTAYPELAEDQLVIRVNRVLDTFWHVGSIEQLAPGIAILEQFLGTRLNVGTHNRTGNFFFSKLARHRKMNAELRRYLTDKNRADYRIYTTWCK